VAGLLCAYHIGPIAAGPRIASVWEEVAGGATTLRWIIVLAVGAKDIAIEDACVSVVKEYSNKIKEKY
jgi:hypothetical protein